MGRTGRVSIVVCSLLLAADAAAAQTANGAIAGQAGAASEPVVIRQVNPLYTSAAMREKVQGSVEVQAVVLADGTVGDVRVTRSLDQRTGLDEAAIKAAKNWLFRPAMKDGTPVEKTVVLVMDFRMTASPEVATDVDRDDPFARGVRRLDERGLRPPQARLEQTPGIVNAARRADSPLPAVAVDFVILADGTVGRARVARVPGAPAGVTDEAVFAIVGRWRFSPASLDGRAVPVLARAYVAVPRSRGGGSGRFRGGTIPDP